MPTSGKKLLRLLPPLAALAVLGGVCLWEVERISARAQGYGDKPVVINELCAHNLSGLQDGNGNCGDWIELYNPGNTPVDLSGWSLTDDKDDPDRWVFPEGTVIDEYLVVFADNGDTRDAAGYWHTSFALKTDGETLYLYDDQGELVDRLKYPEQDYDITYGRAFGSGDQAGTFATATPGAANPVDFLDQEREAALGTAEFSLPAGFYEDPIQVSLEASDPDALIFYTTDGSDPKDNGKLYTGAITIESRAGEPNAYVSIPNRFGYGYSEFLKSYAYNYAPEPVDKATTLTVRLYKDGCWSEEITASTYWVGVETHTMPVVSVTADEQDLFGPEGIYTPGTSYYTALQQGKVGGKSANFLSGEKIDAMVQLCDGGNTLSLPAEISIAGQNSRVWFAMKNLGVNLEDEEDSKILQRMLDQQNLEGFSLKATGNGSWQYFYVDGFWNNYLYGKSLGAQHNVPVVLYLEDEYWGIYCLRNKKNETFIGQKYNVSSDSVTICTSTEPDEEDSIKTLDAELRNLICNDAGWLWINENFDVDAFIDYLIPNLYANNWDGIRTASNTIIWKADKGISQQYADGRWRFLLNDFDMTLIYGFMDPIGDLLDNQAETNNMQHVLFQKLWEYEEFRTRFAEKFRTEMKTTYAPENILPAFEAWCDQLEPEMERNIQRQKVETTWLAPLADWLTGTQSDVEDMTMEQWEADRQELCDFLTCRADDLLEYLDMHLAEAENG